MQHWDELVKAGQPSLVRSEIPLVRVQDVPRDLLCPLADLGRRVQLHSYVVRLLKPYVKPELDILPGSTTRERALFASGLMRLGAHNEADKILKSVSDKKDPQLLLFRSHLEILRWNYGKSIFFLKSYLKVVDSNSYPHLVGRLNLADAYVVEMDWIKAEAQLQELARLSREKKLWLIYSNCLELLARMALNQKKFSQVQSYLEEASQNLKGSGANSELYVEKWKVLAKLIQQGLTPETQAQLMLLQATALQKGNWETLREIDFFKAMALRSKDLFLQVYFGTDFLSYRKRMKRIYKPTFQIPRFYQHFMGVILEKDSGMDTVMNPIPWIDLLSGRTSDLKQDLSQNPVLLGTLRALSRDFYRPVRVGQLMESLFPDEHFNPITSPQRIFQCIRRLRRWFRESGFPLQIRLHQGQYQLQATGPIHLKIYQAGVRAPVNRQLEQFLAHWTEIAFTSVQFRERAGLQERSAQRVLQKAVSEKILEKIQIGHQVLYKMRRGRPVVIPVA